MKHILAVQVLSCVGRCSLTVAQPILSAMGICCSVLPTAVLSTHTGFPDPHIRSMTEDMGAIFHHLKSVGASFAGILVGYLSDPKQAEAVAEGLQTFDCPVILDPAMGDNGKLYRGITQDHVAAMRELAAMAEVVLPNVTEAAMLTGLPYQEQVDGQYLRMLLGHLCRLKTQTALITGTHHTPEQTGFVGIRKGAGMFSYRADRRKLSLHGAGDMFGAVFAGAYLLDRDPMEAGHLAAAFVERVLDHTPEATPFGGEFETQLPWLWKQL